MDMFFAFIILAGLLAVMWKGDEMVAKKVFIRVTQVTRIRFRDPGDFCKRDMLIRGFMSKFTKLVGIPLMMFAFSACREGEGFG
ncbi:hypothetical protein SAMN05444392_11090 [Seinonella peptonophila]|uniref:Uncharacterized protein n=1 Tax=Seinonella peptonophila TaxID=112248 RepID=A0A1M4ZS97_9BACL|nr:hypothetical protein [Seinonella peptonophila]SHF20943.1 hypothetical protein SAMN05444392_11090 [Seinonella peptonophila]